VADCCWRAGGFFCKGFTGSGDGGCGSALQLLYQGDKTGKSFFAGLLVARNGVGGVFARAHEAVAGAVVGDWLIFLVSGLHGFGGRGDGCADASVIAGVEAVDGRCDGGDVSRAGAIEDEGGGEIFAVGCEGEGFPATPAEADGGDLAVACGNLLCVVGYGVEIGIDALGIETGYSFGGGVHAGKFAGAAAVGAEAGEKIGSDDDEALGGELVCHLLGPVAEAEDLMDKNDDGCLLLDLGVDDEGLDGAVAVFDRGVFVVAGRGFEAGLCPVLCVGDEREEQEEGEEFQGRSAHGRSVVPKRISGQEQMN